MAGNFTIRFGIMSIPVKKHPAARNSGVEFKTLHAACGSPTNVKKTCPACASDVETADTVKGYEAAKGTFVQVTQDELDSLDVEKNPEMDIVSFVAMGEIDPVYLGASSYLGPDVAGRKAFALFRAALEQRGQAAIVQYIDSNREKVAVIRAYPDGALMLHEAFYPDEIRDFAKENKVALYDQPLKDDELALACLLVERSEGDFDGFAGLTDKRVAAIRALIAAKLEGADAPAVVATPKPKAPEGDLMAQLRASLTVIDGKKKAEKKKPGAKVRPITTAVKKSA